MWCYIKSNEDVGFSSNLSWCGEVWELLQAESCAKSKGNVKSCNSLTLGWAGEKWGSLITKKKKKGLESVITDVYIERSHWVTDWCIFHFIG